jgi:hypothetical protein
MGIACATPQAHVCNLIGLAVWLRSRAVTATATIDGRRLRLNSRKWSDKPVGGKHKFLAGFLQPGPFLRTATFKALLAGLGAEGWRAPITTVHLIIDYGGGRSVRTTTNVVGLGGWG